ncbi:MAG: hypothetical protein IJ121_02140 [Eubacterium sp.]|nr:hypothetical protein [Eubacterium sp.]
MFALEYHDEITRRDLRNQGSNDLADILSRLKRDGRMEEFERALVDEKYRNKLLETDYPEEGK